MLDRAIADDILTVTQLITLKHEYPSAYGREPQFAAVTLPKIWRKVLVRTFVAIFYETHPDGESQYCRKLCAYPRALSRRQASVQARSSSATPSDIDH